MNKKKILIVNYNMIVGGSTTSLISFLNAIDKERYDVDLLLYKNEGALFGKIPPNINVLVQAFKHEGVSGKILKYIKFISSGYLMKARRENKKLGHLGYSNQIMSDFQAIYLSRNMSKRYDYAIGFLEGWADRYVAYQVTANKKYGWLHSTFDKIAPNPTLEEQWMSRMDKIVCVAESCRKDFCKSVPSMKSKSITIENILDADFIKNQSKKEELKDRELQQLKKYGGFKIVSVCRLAIETKGLDRVILASKQMVQSSLNFRWYIVGDGSDKMILEQMICDNNLQEYVVLTGKRDNPYPFLAEADVMCMPSRWEGKPMTVIESLAVGTPCIVTEYLSAKEQIKSGLEGIVVENTDDSIFKVLKECIEDITIVEKMKEYIQKQKYGNKEYMRTIEKELFYE